MKRTREILSLVASALTCAVLSATPVSADFHCPDNLSGDVVSAPTSWDGYVYNEEGLYAGRTKHSALVVVLRPGAAFPDEILRSDENKLHGYENQIVYDPSPWQSWYPMEDGCLPIDKTAPQYEKGVFEQTFSAKRLSANLKDPCGSVYRGALEQYSLSDCWQISPTLLDGDIYVGICSNWWQLVYDLQKSPAVQGIYEVGYTTIKDTAGPAGGFLLKTTAHYGEEAGLTAAYFAGVTVSGYPDFAVTEILTDNPDSQSDFNNGCYHIAVTGIEKNDTAGYYKAWQAMNDFLQKNAPDGSLTVLEIPLDTLDTNDPVEPRQYSFVDAFYEAPKPNAGAPELAFAGDTNRDNGISIADLVLLCRYVAEDEELTDAQRAGVPLNGDCDGDAVYTAGDITKLSRYLAKLISMQELSPFCTTDYTEMPFTVKRTDESVDSQLSTLPEMAFMNGNFEYWLDGCTTDRLILNFENGDQISLKNVVRYGLVPTARLVVPYPNTPLYSVPIGDALKNKTAVLFQNVSETDYSTMTFTVSEIHQNLPYGQAMTYAFTVDSTEYWFSCDCIVNLQLTFANGDVVPLSDVLSQQLISTERLIVPYPNVTLYQKPAGTDDDWEKVSFENETIE